MAPFVGPTRQELLAELSRRNPRLPITLGVNQPMAVVDERDGRWLLIPLEMDNEAAKRAGDEALAKGQPWMPEHTFRFLKEAKPTIDEGDKDAFIERIRSGRYPYGQEGRSTVVGMTKKNPGWLSRLIGGAIGGGGTWLALQISGWAPSVEIVAAAAGAMGVIGLFLGPKIWQAVVELA